MCIWLAASTHSKCSTQLTTHCSPMCKHLCVCVCWYVGSYLKMQVEHTNLVFAQRYIGCFIHFRIQAERIDPNSIAHARWRARVLGLCYVDDCDLQCASIARIHTHTRQIRLAGTLAKRNITDGFMAQNNRWKIMRAK